MAPVSAPGAPPPLRDYQTAVCGQVWSTIDAAVRGVLVTAPTGSGKTVVAAAIIRSAVDRGMRVLFLAHRRELVAQAARKLFAAGVDAGIIQAGVTPRPGQAVQVASIQTLHARAIRSRAMEPPPADIVIIDEAHHAPAASYRKIVECNPNAAVIGLTATPTRHDGRGLGGIFDVLLQCPPVAELTRAGWLVPAIVYAPSIPDLTDVKGRAGDYVERELELRMNQPKLVGDVVSNWLRLARGRSTIVFATGVAHSAHLRDEFLRAGVMAEHLDGGNPVEEREAILAGLAAGRVEVVTNCMVLTEGFDAPDVGCLVLARPTKSLGLFLQMIGRGLRPAPGKSDCIVLDHSGAVFMHGLPDDPIAWTLDPDLRAENRAHASRGTHKMPALVTCPECSAVRFEGRPCPVCGWRPRPKPQPVEFLDGDLAAVDRRQRGLANTFTPDQQRKFYSELLWIGAERGYKSGWAWFKYQEKFGTKPAWHVEPTEPQPSTRSWVRSRAIAYARAMDKAGARR